MVRTGVSDLRCFTPLLWAGGYSGLDAVATTGPADAHAVGTRETYGRSVRLTYRWDGTDRLRS